MTDEPRNHEQHVGGTGDQEVARPGTLPSLTVVLPAYNEAAGIERTLSVVQDELRELRDSGVISRSDVIVVDDGSSDGTGTLLDTLSEARDDLTVVHHQTNRTLGAAIRTGFDHSTGDWALYTDADLPFDLRELATAFRIAGSDDADIVSAYRRSRRGEGPRRFIYSHVYNWLVRLRFGLDVRDVNFAGKLIHRRVLDRVELHSEGSFIDAELLVAADRLGFRISQFGVDYTPRTRGVSTLSNLSTIRTIVSEYRRLAPGLDAIRTGAGR